MAIKQAELQQAIVPSNVKTNDSSVSRRVSGKALISIRRMTLNVVVPLMIISGFFLLQMQIDSELSSPATEIVAIMSVVIEIALLCLWNIICDSLNPANRHK